METLRQMWTMERREYAGFSLVVVIGAALSWYINMPETLMLFGLIGLTTTVASAKNLWRGK